MLLAVTGILILAACAPRNLPDRASPPVREASAASGNYFDYVVIIVMENHAICDILTYCGGAAAYETQLANESGLATNYQACGGRSLANYLCLTGASTFGCLSNADPNSDACTQLAWESPNIVDRLADAGLTWKAYLENMTSDCHSPPGDGYVFRHNPFVYYGSIVTNATRCARVVPAGTDDSALLTDLESASSASNYMWLTPNLCNDMDDCPLAVGDAYLSTLVPKILQSPVFTTERAALFITFEDDAHGKGAPNLYTVWSGPVAKVGYTSAVAYNHFSLLSTLEVNWNLAPLNTNDSEAAAMTEFFTGTEPNFSLSAYPWSVSFLEGGSANSTISLQARNGFNGSVALTASSNSSGVSAVCSPASIQGSETSTCTLAGSAAGSFRVTVSGSNGSLVNTVTIDVQVIAPLAAKFTFSPASPFAGRPVQFNGWAAGGLSPFNYAWAFGDGTTASEPRPSHVFSANGTYSVALTIQDASGQTANTSQVVGVAQRTPSVATGVATDVQDVRATLNGQLYYLGEANETLVGFHYGTDPNLINSTNWTAARAIAPQLYSAQVTGLTVNTTYYFEAWASGSGFATGRIASFITLASPPPLVVPTATLQVQGTLGRNGWYVSNVTVALTASAPRGLPAWTNVAVDGGGWVNYSAPLTLHDGRHSLEYYAFLGKGGLAEPHRFANISVDTTPPELSIQGSGEIVTQSSFTIAWTGSDSGSGILAYEVQLDGGSFQSIGTSTSLTLNLEDGAHTITVRATDVAGNVKAQTKALTIDTNPFSPRGPFAGLPLYLLLFAVAVAVGLLRLRRQRKGRRTPPDPWKL